MPDETATYQCTLTRQDSGERSDADRALAARTTATDRLPAGVRISFEHRTDTRALVETFVANESRCCAFFDFAVHETDREVVLEITAPPDEDAQQLVDAAQRTFEVGPDALLPLASWETEDDG